MLKFSNAKIEVISDYFYLENAKIELMKKGWDPLTSDEIQI